VIGDIAVLRVLDGLGDECFRLAEELFRVLPNVRVVLGQVSPVYGEYRLDTPRCFMTKKLNPLQNFSISIIFKIRSHWSFSIKLYL